MSSSKKQKEGASSFVYLLLHSGGTFLSPEYILLVLPVVASYIHHLNYSHCFIFLIDHPVHIICDNLSSQISHQSYWIASFLLKLNFTTNFVGTISHHHHESSFSLPHFGQHRVPLWHRHKKTKIQKSTTRVTLKVKMTKNPAKHLLRVVKFKMLSSKHCSFWVVMR